MFARHAKQACCVRVCAAGGQRVSGGGSVPLCYVSCPVSHCGSLYTISQRSHLAIPMLTKACTWARPSHARLSAFALDIYSVIPFPQFS